MSKGFLIQPSSAAARKPRMSKSSMRQLVLIDKLNSPIGYSLLFLLMASIGVGIAYQGMVFGMLILVAAIGIPMVYAVVTYPKIGVIVFIQLAYWIMFISKFGINFPLGTVMDGMEGLLIFGMLLQLRRNKDWQVLKGPISVAILTWIIYNVLEIANPVTEVRGAWIYTVRAVALIMLIYFVFLYNIRTKAFVKFIIKMWLVLAFIAAAYAWKQEHFGFFPFEEAILNADPMTRMLLFIGGTWRKFSIFTDPVVFAYTMAISVLLCFGLMTGPISRSRKLILWGLILFFTLNMLYSGTRGAYVLIPSGMLLFTVLRFNKKILMLAILGAAVFVTLIVIPTQNYTLYRFQSAFKPSDDASFNVRKMNQKRIQPYILSHPMGGGLGATGEWGMRFAPYSFLAHFPPDSGYVRVAVELGWLGLLIFCIFMFTVLKVGINNYYMIRDPELKSYALAMVLIVFAFNIGTYPQESIVQFPSNVNFYLVIALIAATRRIDNEQNALLK